MLFALAEAETGIEHDAELIHTGAAGAIGAGVQIFHHRQHDIRGGRQFGPSFGRAAHVVDYQAGIVFDDHFRNERIEGEAAWIVDDIGAVFKGEGGDFGLISIDRDRNLQLAFQSLQNGDEAAEFFGGGDAGAAGLGGFGADIEDIGSFGFELDGAGDGEIGIVILAAIGEGIGRDVQDGDDESAFAEAQFT